MSSEEATSERRAAWEQHLSKDGDRILFEIDELLDAAEEAYQDGLHARNVVPRRSEAFERYMAIVHGKLAAQNLSPQTEAELAEIQDEIWRSLSPEEQAVIDPGLIEEAKARWSP